MKAVETKVQTLHWLPDNHSELFNYMSECASVYFFFHTKKKKKVSWEVDVVTK